MISAMLVLAVLGQHVNPETYRAPPNVFEPSEVSSEAIFATVAVCMDDAVKQGASEKHAVNACGCLMDAVRANLRKGLKGADANATPEQRRKCQGSPTPVPKRPETNGKVGT